MTTEIKQPVKESYEAPQIVGETGSPEVQAQEEVKPESTQPPPNQNLRFKCVINFDNGVNTETSDLLMPPQYANNRVMLVKKGKVLSRNWDKITGIETTQYELDEKHPDYIKPEEVNGQEQTNP